MKKNTFLSNFLLIITITCGFISQKINSQNLIHPQASDSLFIKGKLIVRNISKDTLEIAAFKNGKKNGKQDLFNNGIIYRSSTYENGLLNGKVLFFQNGSKTPYKIENHKAFPKEKISRLHGDFKNYNYNGDLMELYTFKNGEKNGKYETYNTNGKLKEKGTLENNLNIGTKLTYNSDGKLIKNETYIILDNPKYIESTNYGNPQKKVDKIISNEPKKISVLHGKAKYYNANNQISAELNYKNGLKEGINKEYYINKTSQLKSKIFYKNGLEHGAYSLYNVNGNLRSKGILYLEIKVNDTILKKVYDGLVQEFEENGKLRKQENWKNYKKNGSSIRYNHTTGKVYEQSFYIDNLLSGSYELFDNEGNKSMESFYEIVEKDGKKISQKTGTESYWVNNKLTNTAEWKDGNQNGSFKNYYPNGELKELMIIKNGRINGLYQTFYENGQKHEVYNKHVNDIGSFDIDWNIVYDESGEVSRKFFADKKGKKIVSYKFDSGKPNELLVDDIFRLGFASATQQLNRIQWINPIGSILNYETFANFDLRRIQFSIADFFGLTANFTQNGELIQVVDATGNHIENKKVNETVKKIAKQFNPKWKDEKLASEKSPNGKHIWKYADGNPFFEIEFENELPQGKWILYNPIVKDTLFYSEFKNGLPINKLVIKNMDGKTEVRQEYYTNKLLKEISRYDTSGYILSVIRNDSLGNLVFSEEYYPFGKIKNRNYHNSTQYIHFENTGDTLSYRLLAPVKDSIIINRDFYPGNKLKKDHINNLTKEIGFTKTYFENGQMQTLHELKNNKAHGAYKKFNEAGVLVTSGNFKNGNRDGEWINYSEKAQKEVSLFKDGEIVIDVSREEPNNSKNCKCYDTSLTAGKIGFANSLSSLSDFKSIKPYIPKNILPINNWNYDKIFFINLITNNTSQSGSTDFKLLLLNDFSFHYPANKSLKITLNPCKTEGYIDNIKVNLNYNFETKELIYAYLNPKRVSVSLEKNPLVETKTKNNYTAYFDVDNIYLNTEGIENIQYAKDKNTCFPLGRINDFFEIEILDAYLDINPKNRFLNSDIPIFINELNSFYGLVINEAKINFQLNTININAKSEKMLAGTNFVAGKLILEGKAKDKNTLVLEDGVMLDISNLQKVLEQKGFYRVKVETIKNQLTILFYAEK